MRTAFMFISFSSFTSISWMESLRVRPVSGHQLWRLVPFIFTWVPFTKMPWPRRTSMVRKPKVSVVW